MAITMPRTLSLTALDTEEEEECWNDEDCRTPTAAESRIPQVETCPPAPMKQRPAAFPAVPVARTNKFFNPPCLDSVFALRKAY